MDNIVSEKEVDITSLEVALRSAGDNRGELEKIFCYYKRKNTDSLKYKAACYLIENMPFHRYSVGEQLENYKSYYAWLKKSKGKEPQQVAVFCVYLFIVYENGTQA